MIEVICIWFVFVETKGLTLEEVGSLLDSLRDGSSTDHLKLEQIQSASKSKRVSVEYNEDI